MATGTPPSTRERIIETAIDLFGDRGTVGTSMRDLAEAAGITVPGLYYHFRAKSDLVRAALKARGLDGLFDPSPAALVELPPDVEGRVAAQARAELARMTAETAFLKLIIHETIREDPEARTVLAELGQAWDARWRSVLAEARDLRPGADVQGAAACIRAFLWGMFSGANGRSAEDTDAVVVAFARLVGTALSRPRRKLR